MCNLFSKGLITGEIHPNTHDGGLRDGLTKASMLQHDRSSSPWHCLEFLYMWPWQEYVIVLDGWFLLLRLEHVDMVRDRQINSSLKTRLHACVSVIVDKDAL